jgi:hypothetical protein
MNSEPAPINGAGRPAKVKDVLIGVLALCLCFSLAALIHETRQRQEYSQQVEKLQSQQRIAEQSLAAAGQNKLQSDRALRRAQLAMKAGSEAQGIALRLRQTGGKTAQSR